MRNDMPPHILVVEDSATQARVVQRVLESAGYEIELARSGEEGLALFDAERCDAVISDVVMPGAIDGYELCRRIKGSESGRATPVMLLTSLSSPMDIISGLAAGADNFLTKPYDAAHLVERVQVLLRTREARASHKPRVGVEVYFMGQTFNITSDREQILDLLISTFEDAVRQNHALREREQELSEARAQLARHADTLEARLESVLRSVPDVLFSMGGERFSVQYVSPASVRVTGHTPEEFTNDGDLWMRIVHEEDRPALEAALLRVRGGAVANEQFRMRHRDGEDRWIQATFVAVLNPRGQVVQIDGIARDVTAAKRLERATVPGSLRIRTGGAHHHRPTGNHRPGERAGGTNVRLDPAGTGGPAGGDADAGGEPACSPRAARGLSAGRRGAHDGRRESESSRRSQERKRVSRRDQSEPAGVRWRTAHGLRRA